MPQIDPRIVRVSLEINGQLKVFEGLNVEASGCKYANPLQNDASVKIANLTKSDRDYLLTECSPFNKNHTPKILILEAGRVSTGVSKIFQGNIIACVPTQPPDIILEFKCQTGAFVKGKIVSAQQSAAAALSEIAKGVAGSAGLTLNFQATDKTIANYSFTGGALKQIENLQDSGGVNAYADDDELVVKDYNVALAGVVRVLSADSGMIGIPEVTEQGIKVKYLLDNQTKLGGGLEIVSVVYPSLNGTYVIFKLGWHVTSRDDPFYWIPEAVRVGQSGQLVKPNPVPKNRKHAGKHVGREHGGR